MSEAFDAVKFAKSFVEPLGYVKAISILIKIVMVVSFVGGIGWAVYRTYIKPPKTTEIRNVEVQKGGKVFFGEEQKKHWETFVEPYTQLDTDGEWRSGLRCGLRF